MNNSGIVRKIDELGRIVIPKEIRNTLNIKNGESIEIKVINEEIILKKYYKMKNEIDDIKKYINIMDLLLDCSIVVTDREKVIVATQKCNQYIGERISLELTNIIEERKLSVDKTINKFKLLKNEILEGSYIIMPIIVDTDLLGCIFAIKSTPVKETDILAINILNYLIKDKYLL